MYQKYHTILFILLWSGGIFAQSGEPDMTAQVELEEVVVSSTKETNELKALPGSISFITPRILNERKIISIVDLSAVIPNFFVPDYGSKMSTPVYIRGIGERSTGQAVGLYVDHMPYLDKSVFNFDFLDVQRLEALRGPQGTLYGRNAMGGIINIFTHSPLDDERTRITLTAGNYGLWRANASISRKIGKIAGISLSGYYDGNNGFFENQHDGKSADQLRSAGGRFRMDLKPAEKWNVQLMANYDYSDQGAFPYGKYIDGDIAEPDYDTPGKYTREVTGGNAHLEYKNDRIIFSSSTGFQYFDDDMRMDLDYSPQPVFTMNQLQREKNWTQEFTVKSNTRKNYRWSLGAFGFSRNLRTDVVTTLEQGAISGVLQPVFDGIAKNNPLAPMMVVTDSEMPIPGTFKTPAYGGALFHQSTCNNLWIEGLSLTAGIRLDHEKTKLDYHTSMSMNLDVTPRYRPGLPAVQSTVDTTLAGSESMSFTEILPRVALRYAFDNSRYVYFSVAKGYKAGGYNIQMFADLVRNAVMARNSGAEPVSVKDAVSYQPEYSWNYELGYKGEIVKNRLDAEVAVFYVNVKDVQITQFVQSGQGRLLKNAGRAESVGTDLSLTAHLIEGLALSANYGFTHATLKDYETEGADYSGNYIPFAPQNTFSLSAGYSCRFRNSRILDRFHIHAQYNGAGRIYWTEANDASQDFYGLLNLKAGVTRGIFSLNVWTKNTLNTGYAAFYFVSASQQSPQVFAQKGAPFQTGIDLTVAF
ncbi:MAG: TonB-dependent receptor [Bacteroidales bacterium]|jgi:outer membrane receptor protein involved in Fe transport|nr:TonB-dependent receptor [Bacteroidales bacterium]